MPAKDIYHDNLKNAIIKDGWIITHNPLRLTWGAKDMYVDLGAEQLLAAEKTGRKIAIEIKSFVGASEMNDLEKAIGQYVIYRSVMTRTEPDRTLYLAIHNEIFLDIFEEPLGKLLLEDHQVCLIVYDLQAEVILKWIP
ncbi:XisH family protein [bacterium]|nr:XisH family protein [bacterium]